VLKRWPIGVENAKADKDGADRNIAMAMVVAAAFLGMGS
jgi:hypothetical protein